MAAEITAALRFELSRLARPGALAFALACVALAVRAGYATLENHAMVLQSAGAGATAQDVFLGTLCDSTATGLFLPLGASALLGGMACGDAESGMRDVLLTRLRHRSVWWLAKVLCALVASVGLMAVACVGSWAFDALVMGTPMSAGGVSEWLACPGGLAEAPWELYTVMPPIPSEWNVYALELALVCLYGSLYAGLVLLAELACLRSSRRWAPQALLMGALVSLRLLRMAQTLGFLYESLAWMCEVPVVRMPLGRLCVSGYALGMGPFDDALAMGTLASAGDVVLVAANSMASGVALALVPLVCAALVAPACEGLARGALRPRVPRRTRGDRT